MTFTYPGFADVYIFWSSHITEFVTECLNAHWPFLLMKAARGNFCWTCPGDQMTNKLNMGRNTVFPWNMVPLKNPLSLT